MSKVMAFFLALAFSVNVYAGCIDIDLKKDALRGTYQKYLGEQKLSDKFKLSYDGRYLNGFINGTWGKIPDSEKCAQEIKEGAAPSNYEIYADNGSCGKMGYMQDRFTKTYLSRLICTGKTASGKKVPCFIDDFLASAYSGLKTKIKCKKESKTTDDVICRYDGDMYGATRDMIRVAVIDNSYIKFLDDPKVMVSLPAEIRFSSSTPGNMGNSFDTGYYNDIKWLTGKYEKVGTKDAEWKTEYTIDLGKYSTNNLNANRSSGKVSAIESICSGYMAGAYNYPNIYDPRKPEKGGCRLYLKLRTNKKGKQEVIVEGDKGFSVFFSNDEIVFLSEPTADVTTASETVGRVYGADGDDALNNTCAKPNKV